MQLATAITGSGPQTAVLVHGIMSDHRAWHRVADELAERGFRVIAVDLAGHGASSRRSRYSLRAWADDVVETVRPLLRGAPDLLMGHSLGAVVASWTVSRLAPKAVVYIDPAFAFPSGARGLLFKLAFACMPKPGRRTLARMNPGWTDAEIALELEAVRSWDRRTIFGLVSSRWFAPPRRVRVPSLVVLAERSLLITPEAAADLVRIGMQVVTVPGTGHNVWRDDHVGFLAQLRRWIPQLLGQAAVAG